MPVSDEDKEVDVALDTAEKPSSTVPAQFTPMVDGGLRAWLSVLGGWIVMFCTFGYANSFGVYQDYYTLDGTSTSFAISWIGSIQIFFAFFMGLPTGRLLDRGYLRSTIMAGTLVFVFSMFMLSLAHPLKYYQLFLSQGVGLGLGSGLLLVPAQSVQAHHWKKRRAFAMGIVATGAGFGGIVYPIMLNQLIHSRVGFAWGVRATAFLTLGLLLVAVSVMTVRLPNGAGGQARPKPTIRSIFSDLAYVCLVVGLFFSLWGTYYPFFYLQLWVNLHGLSNNLAFYTLAIMNAASIPGRVLPNIVADRYGAMNVLCPVICIMGILVFAMFGATTTGGVIVFSILYGFFTGAFLSVVVPALASFARNIDEVGVRIGMAYCINSFPLLTGTPIDGALLGAKAEWYRATTFSGIVLITGSALATVSRFLVARRKGVSRI